MRAHVFVAGRVQGVFFRQETHRHAAGRANGWVRNLADGRVEAVLEGPRFVLDPIIAWMHQGPRYAQVERVEVAWERPAGEGPFRVR